MPQLRINTRRSRRNKQREWALHSDAITMVAIDNAAVDEAMKMLDNEFIHGKLFYLDFIYPTVFNDANNNGIHFGRMQYKNYF